jgi:hypothetical protein
MFGCHENDVPWENHLGNLRWDTPASNSRDMILNGASRGQERTCCPRRHPLSAPNLVASRAAKGQRVCLACARARAKKQRANGTFDLQAVSDEYYNAIMQRT